MIVGLDTKTRAYHWTVDPGFGRVGARYGWCVREKLDPELARIDLFRAAKVFFGWLPSGSHVFCEEPLALQNGKTTRLLNLAAGAIWAAFVAADVDATWYWIDAAAWKKAVLGRGAPPKGQKHKPWIEESLLARPDFLEWQQVSGPDTRGDFMLQADLYDAWCLMQYGMQVVES